MFRQAENTDADAKTMEREAHREMERWPHVRASVICPHCFGPKEIDWPICGACREKGTVPVLHSNHGKYTPEVLRSIRMAERALEEADVFNDVFDAEWAAMERSLGVRW